MNWPNHTDYQDSIQNPQICFENPELKKGTVATDMLGMPRVMSGNFASVYELTTEAGHWAIRCFVRQVTGQQARYTVLSKHLSAVDLPFIVPFEYIGRGIRVRSDWYPIVKMQWVEGAPLQMYLDERLPDPEVFRPMPDRWRELLRGLRANKIAHGDLQHGNIMVTPDGELRLVDYDGMYVPGFGRGRSPELGHPNFQHPRRTPEFYGIDLDNFSALIVHLSFLALQREPTLWERHNTGDNLIFVAEDFKAPGASTLMKHLKESPDPVIEKLTVLLEWCCLRPVTMVPDFEATLEAVAKGEFPIDLSATASTPIEKGTPNWLEGSTPAPSPGQSGGTEPAPLARTESPWSRSGTRPVTPAGTSPASSSRPSPSGLGPDEAPSFGVNVWAFVAAGLAVLSFLPNLRLPAGLAAAVVGVIGLVRSRPAQPWSRWVATLAAVLGGGMAMMSVVLFGPIPSGDPDESSGPGAAQTDPARNGSSSAGTGPAPGASVRPGPAETETETSPQPRRPALDLGRIRPLGPLPGHGDAVEVIAFSPDSTLLGTGSRDGVVRIWRVESGSILHEFTGHEDGVEGIYFLSNPDRVVTVSVDNVIRIWTLPGETPTDTLTEYRDSSLFAVALAPDRDRIAAGSLDRRAVRLLSFPGGKLQRELTDHSSFVKSVVFSPDGDSLAVLCFDESFRIWNLSSGGSADIDATGNQVAKVAFNADGTLAAAGVANRRIRIWDLADNLPLRDLEGHPGQVNVIAFAPRHGFVASGGADGSVRLWEIRTGDRLREFTDHTGAILAMAFAADGGMMATGGEDQTVRLWDLSRLAAGGAPR